MKHKLEPIAFAPLGLLRKANNERVKRLHRQAY